MIIGMAHRKQPNGFVKTAATGNRAERRAAERREKKRRKQKAKDAANPPSGD